METSDQRKKKRIVSGIRRLVWSTLLCTIVFCVLCSSAIVIGRLQPEQSFMPELQWCDGIPCYMGIILGKTTTDEFAKMVENRSGTSKLNGGGTEYSLTGPIQVMRFVTGMDNTIRRIVLDADGLQINAAILIAHWGSPCAISRSENNIVLAFQHIDVWVHTNKWRVALTSPAYQIYLFASDTGDACDQPGLLKWRGFTQYISLDKGYR